MLYPNNRKYIKKGKLMKNKAFTIMLASIMLALTACGSTSESTADNSTSVGQETDNAGNADTNTQEDGSDADNTSSTAGKSFQTVNLTIEDAIDNHMRYVCEGYYSLYAKDNLLYSSGNCFGSFYSYLWNVSNGEAGTQVKQVDITDYTQYGILLDTDGNLLYNGMNFFEGYNVAYFSCFVINNVDPQRLVAVTSDGDIYIVNPSDPEEPRHVDGLQNVKYVDVSCETIAFVREDGSAGYAIGYSEIHELDGWSDISMIYIYGRDDEFTDVVGLKSDGTLVMETIDGSGSITPNDLLSWSDIVYVDLGYGYVAGLQSNGSYVYAISDELDEYSAKELEESYGTWTNVIAGSSSGAIGADGTLYGLAQQLAYIWDLTEPVSEDWEGADALQAEEYELDEHNQEYSLTLPTIP